MPNTDNGTAIRSSMVIDEATGGVGPSNYTLVSAATTNATNLKVTRGRIFSILAYNVNAADRWLKIFNKASAPTVGTDTPILNILLPKGGLHSQPIRFGDMGLVCPLGIGFALTTGIALLDNAAVAAGDISLNILYS